MAALAVLLTHVSFISGTNGRGHWGAYLARMDVGVSVFFLISGFLLYRPFAAAHLEERPAPRPGAFFRRRFLRIFPAYWLALSVTFFVFDKGRPHGIGDFAVYYGLLQTYSKSHVFGGISQAWSLCTEISFYLFLPAYAWLLGRRPPHGEGPRLRRELVGVVVLLAAGVASRLFVVSTDVFDFDVAINWLPNYLDLFGLGMGMAVLSEWRQGRPAAERSGLWSRPGVAGASWALALLCFWAVSTRAGLPRTALRYTTGQWMAREVLYAGTALFLLLPAVFGPQGRGSVRRFLRARPVVWLGLVSYGTYLWHELWIDRFYRCPGWLRHAVDCRRVPPFGGQFDRVLFSTLLLTLSAAVLSYWAVEKPALRFKTGRPRRGARSRRAGPPTVPVAAHQ